MYKAENDIPSQPCPQPEVLKGLSHFCYMYINMLFRFLIKMRLYMHPIPLSAFSDKKKKTMVEIVPYVALLYLVRMVFL